MKQILLLVMAVWLVGIAQPPRLLAQVDVGARADGDANEAKGRIDGKSDGTSTSTYLFIAACGLFCMAIEGFRKRRKKAEQIRALKAYDGKPEAKEGDTDD
ncbi:MAG TPA: hypothetical protein EYQ62_11260 [Verrucomicrobiales bacterium]|nr:hypothetical protein [Verrucomicrobiales bacterium]HIL24889.1 hypothetical protein [Verrucomicrobiota bacterium]